MQFIRLAGVLSLVALLIVASGKTARAQTAQSFTLPAGGKAVIGFEAFCLNFGRAFPGTLQMPNGVASDQVQAALAHAQNQNLTDAPQEAEAVQYAIWRFSAIQGSPQGEALT